MTGEQRRPGVVGWVAKLLESKRFRTALVELGWQPPEQPDNDQYDIEE
jgi:hypothetical protein